MNMPQMTWQPTPALSRALIQNLGYVSQLSIPRYCPTFLSEWLLYNFVHHFVYKNDDNDKAAHHPKLKVMFLAFQLFIFFLQGSKVSDAVGTVSQLLVIDQFQ